MTTRIRPVSREIVLLPVASIRRPKTPLRQGFDEEADAELSESQEESGTLCPVIVQLMPDGGYELVIGDRRLRTAKEEIPALIIYPLSPLDALVGALVENLHRLDLTPFEEGLAVLRLVKDHALEIKEVARRIRKPETFVRRRLQLLSLPEETQRLIAAKSLSLGHVGVLAGLPTHEEQIYYGRVAVQYRLSDVELVALIRESGEEKENRRRGKPLTAKKARLKLKTLVAWIKSLRHDFPHITDEDRNFLMEGLRDLTIAIRMTQRALGIEVEEEASASVPSFAPQMIPRNHGIEWPAAHISRITDPNRPSDEVLAAELGRTVGSIQVMRSKVNKR